MLESEYAMTVTEMYLAVVHPEIPAGRLVSCPRMQNEIEAVVQYEIPCGRARAAAVPGEDAPFLL